MPCTHVQIHDVSSNKPAKHSPNIDQYGRRYAGFLIALVFLLFPFPLRQVTEAGGMTKFIDSGAAKLRIEEAATKKQVGCLTRKLSVQVSEVVQQDSFCKFG